MASSKLRIDLSGISKRELQAAWDELSGVTAKVRYNRLPDMVGKAIVFKGDKSKLPESVRRYASGK